MLAVALVFGMAAAGCRSEDPALNGTWATEWGMETRFDNGSFEVLVNGDPYVRGTYTARDGAIAMTITHLHEDGQWLDRAMIRAMYGSAELLDDTFATAVDSMLDAMFLPQMGTYSVTNETLTLTIDGETEVLARR